MTSLAQSFVDDFRSVSVGCLLTIDLLYWVLSGAGRFTSSAVLGLPALDERFFVYLLLLPLFVAVKTSWIAIEYPGAITGQLCPNDTLFDLDWFTIGVFGTALPLTLERIWMWIATVLIFVTLFILVPRLGPDTRILGIVGIGLVQVVGRFFPDVVPSVLRVTLQQPQVDALMDVVLNIYTGPVILGGLAVVVAGVLSLDEVRSLPGGDLLPDKDPGVSVFVSAATGTLLFLLLRGLLF